MDISSVKTPAVRAAPPPKNAAEANAEKSRTAKSQETEITKPPAAKPTPVVNTQGQTTGRLLNVTA
jgi:hypothetical protein